MRERNTCRCCGGTSLIEVLNLGSQPYANAFITSDKLSTPEATAPLILMSCQSCGMAQLRHIVDAVNLYHNYTFLTSSSKLMTEHFAGLMADNVAAYVPPDGLVVEIGSNDGTALASIQRPDVRRLGIDPANNLAVISAERGVKTYIDFFDEISASEVRFLYGRADLIVACNVLGHIDNLDSFCRGVNILLSSNGALIIEVPDVLRLIEGVEFDTVYHEHLSYFHVNPLITLFKQHNLQVQHVVEFPAIHGGSIRLTVRRGDSEYISNSTTNWNGFSDKCENLKTSIRSWLMKQRDNTQTVWGYGAPAKGTVLLNYCGIDRSLLPVVIDSTPTKQGKHVPGTHQFIVKPCELNSSVANSVLVLAWNHSQRFMKKNLLIVSLADT